MYNSNLLLHEEHLSMTLTKIQIVESIHNQIGLPKNKSTEIVETLLEVIKSTLVSALRGVIVRGGFLRPIYDHVLIESAMDGCLITSQWTKRFFNHG